MKNYFVENLSYITSDIISLRLKPKKKADYLSYIPGQYAAISPVLNGKKTPFRCFSLSSSPADKDAIEFGIKVGGNYTQSLTSLKPGDAVSVMGPYGSFTLDANIAYSQPVLIAGGIGITPFVSMLRSAAKSNWPMKLTLIYSVRTIHDAAYLSELVEYANNPNFKFYLFVTSDREKSEEPWLFPGRVSADKLDMIVGNEYTNKSFYICGPSQFMAAMKTNLKSRSVDESKIITEEFSAKTVGKSPQRAVNAYTAIVSLALFLFVILADVAAYSSKTQATQLFNSVSPTTNSVIVSPSTSPSGVSSNAGTVTQSVSTSNNTPAATSAPSKSAPVTSSTSGGQSSGNTPNTTPAPASNPAPAATTTPAPAPVTTITPPTTRVS